MGDSPTFEAWPVPEKEYLHESLLALWGCPLGEMWDLEKLAKRCREMGKWTFFMTSAPANMPGMFTLWMMDGFLGYANLDCRWGWVAC